MANGTTSTAQQTALNRMRQESANWMTQQRARQEALRQQTLSPGSTVSYSVAMPEYQEPPAEAMEILGQIMQTDPYAGAHEAYESMSRELANAYRMRGSQAARSQQQAALATGLTPLEATGVGENAMLEAMRSYYSQLPALRLAQAMLPAQRQEQLSALLTPLAELYGRPSAMTQMQTSLAPLQQAQTGQQDVASRITELLQSLGYQTGGTGAGAGTARQGIPKLTYETGMNPQYAGKIGGNISAGVPPEPGMSPELQAWLPSQQAYMTPMAQQHYGMPQQQAQPAAPSAAAPSGQQMTGQDFASILQAAGYSPGVYLTEGISAGGLTIPTGETQKKVKKEE